ncbi:GGDEF domain-containing protein [Halopseudomonas pelagia]|uniref:Diguanylate cyclase n=2 Tax=Halopseudomonas pelagia TaxID=553151 RepID=A0AA91U158_9GAMM|nr:GGDEF domain-containing protein [Halopseudomonas pelagia]PCC98858.1 diguanylate cyclase [Halopseudomonas pelagia]QFY58312.1 GGDEF domain-containing protein [Halopseudomonas pelagia]
MDLLLDAICVVDPQGHFVYISGACERIFGYTCEELVGTSMMDLVYPDDREKTLATAREVMLGQQKNHFENRYVRKDGQIVHIMWSASWSEEEQLRVAVAHDVTEQKKTEALQAAVYAISEAANSAEDLAALFLLIHQIVARLLPLNLFCVALREEDTGSLNFPYYADQHNSPDARESVDARTLGAEIIASSAPLLLTADTPADDIALHALSDTSSLNWLGVPLITTRGTFGALLLHSSSTTQRYTSRDLELLHYVSTQIASAVQRMQMQSRLQFLSHYDHLTELPNRTLLFDRMEQALARARRDNGKVSLLYLDLDKFKQVNDTYGHGIGDQLLRAVADRLRQCVREVDTVSRVGGDEFVILLENISQPEHALLVAEKIREQLNMPFHLAEHSLTIIPSIGIALYPEHADEQNELLNLADRAMYYAKQSGGNRFEIALKKDRSDNMGH